MQMHSFMDNCVKLISSRHFHQHQHQPHKAKQLDLINGLPDMPWSITQKRNCQISVQSWVMHPMLSQIHGIQIQKSTTSRLPYVSPSYHRSQSRHRRRYCKRCRWAMRPDLFSNHIHCIYFSFMYISCLWNGQQHICVIAQFILTFFGLFHWTWKSQWSQNMWLLQNIWSGWFMYSLHYNFFMVGTAEHGKGTNRECNFILAKEYWLILTGHI